MAANPRISHPINRRDLLSYACIGAATTIVGCKDQPDPIDEVSESRSDVPIQLVLVGSDDDAETIRRAWMSIDEQPLEIKTISADRVDDRPWIVTLREAALSCDLIIYPMMAVAELIETEAIVPIDDRTFEQMQEEYGSFFSAPRNGAARFGGAYVALPLGASLPALLSSRSIPTLGSWGDYDDWVAKELAGKAAEPLAVGWAGAMFLWRAIASIDQGWLFTRDDFTPLVDSEPYVDVLRQMQQTASRYNSISMSPVEVWNALQSGEILAGIGFPGGVGGAWNEEPQATREVAFGDLPCDPKRKQMLLDPFSPIASISSHCRQTSASKRLMNWMSGGEGSQLIRREIDRFTPVRSENASLLVVETQTGTPYEQWLETQLRTPVTAASLQLFAADEYYSVLDQQVVACIAGDASPEQALTVVAERWQAITDRIGKEKQKTAWRRSQGLRA
ncbi:hypothetical protein [Novipirellula aureliae]|nr:hypothetical protein [Novipirellula aureliae]